MMLTINEIASSFHGKCMSDEYPHSSFQRKLESRRQLFLLDSGSSQEWRNEYFFNGN